MGTFKKYLQEADGQYQQQLLKLFNDLTTMRQTNGKLYQDANALVQGSKASVNPEATFVRVVARDIRELAAKVDGEIAQGIQRMQELMQGRG